VVSISARPVQIRVNFLSSGCAASEMPTPVRTLVVCHVRIVG
jgi:hypothetical protein